MSGPLTQSGVGAGVPIIAAHLERAELRSRDAVAENDGRHLITLYVGTVDRIFYSNVPHRTRGVVQFFAETISYTEPKLTAPLSTFDLILEVTS